MADDLPRFHFDEYDINHSEFVFVNGDELTTDEEIFAEHNSAVNPHGEEKTQADVRSNGAEIFPQTDRFGFITHHTDADKPYVPLPLNILRNREKKWLDMLDNWPYYMNKNFEKAGLSDGSINVYKIGLPKALGSFNLGANNEPVNAVQWSPSNPYVFYSLHGNGLICIWNLKNNRTRPVHVESVLGCRQIYLPIDQSNEGKAFMILVFENGSFEIHRLKDDGKTYTAADGHKISAIVERL